VKTEGTARKMYRTRDEAKADVYRALLQSEAQALDNRLSQPRRVRKASHVKLKMVSTNPAAGQF